MMLLTFITVVVGVLAAFGSSLVPVTSAIKCQHKTPSWGCSDLPTLTLEFDQVVIDDCGGLYEKQLFDKFRTITYLLAKKNSTYTVIMVDPDAPDHDEESGEVYLLFLRVYISGSDLLYGMKMTGKSIMKYEPPDPLPGTGPHRISTYLYKQQLSDDPGDRSPLRKLKKRNNFNLTAFVEDEELCGPLAHTMFLTKSHLVRFL